MRISDWSSDVCSSDLLGDRAILAVVDEAGGAELSRDIGRDIEIEIAILRHGELALGHVDALAAQQTLHACEPLVVDDARQPLIARAIGNPGRAALGHVDQIGRASCREKVGTYVSISVVAES